MKEEEKAKELIEKFKPYARLMSSGFLVSNEDVTIIAAKQCALICVEEILKTDPLSPSKFDTKVSKGEAYIESECKAYEYWQKVKSILESK